MGYRDYMARSEAPMGFSSGVTPGVRNLLWTNVGMYLAFNLLFRHALAPLAERLALSRTGLLLGRFWQPVTYQFLHEDLSHLLLNMVGLYLLAPDVERALGSRRFLFLYLFAGALGGMGFVLLNATAPCIGASGAVYGILAAFAALYPSRRLTFLLFPFVSFPAWTVVLFFGLIEFTSMLSRPFGGIAHSAHLIGGLAGWIYARALTARALFPPGASGWLRRRMPRRDSAPPSSAEVNRILDKVATRGLHSLTSRERERLELASRNRMPRG